MTDDETETSGTTDEPPDDGSVARALASMAAPKTDRADRWEVIEWAQMIEQTVEQVHRQWRRGLLLVGIAALTCVAVAAGRADEAGIEVVETGFSWTGGDVGFGVVVENPTDHTAYHTVVCVRLDDDSDDDDGCYEYTIEVMLPGQRVGFGSAGSRSDGKTTGLHVEVRGPSEWLDPDDELYGEIVASDVLLAYSPEDEPVVSFVATQEGDGRIVRNATGYALFRNEDGDIVGGASVDLDGPVARGQPVRQTLYVIDEVAELASAEVYVFPSGV